jgi:cysteine desulfurase family protein
MLKQENSLIYLNNAATSWPKPPGVIQAVQESLELPFGGGRGTGKTQRDYLTEGRETVAQFFGEESPDTIVFSSNATDALNTLIHGFTASSPEKFHVITTTLEHNSVLRPLHHLEKKGRIELDHISFSNAKVNPEAIIEAVTDKTRLVVMNHGSNVLGSVQNIRAVGEYLHDKDIFFIVDGSQTAGHIPLDLSAIEFDAFVFTGHKALFGMPGIGGFCIRNPDPVLPVRMGGTGTDSGSLDQPGDLPERYEIGTHNYPGIASLIAGITFLQSIGMDALQRRADRQTELFIKELSSEPGITIYNPDPELPIIAFNIPGLDNDDVGYILARKDNIVVRTGLHCAPLLHKEIDDGAGCVRISPSWFTTDEECRIAADAIKEIAHHAYSQI